MIKKRNSSTNDLWVWFLIVDKSVVFVVIASVVVVVVVSSDVTVVDIVVVFGEIHSQSNLNP